MLNRHRRRTVSGVCQILLLASCLITACSRAVAGDGPPAAPILRVETGAHMGEVSSVAIDASGRYLVTASSSDKTVRVWDARDGGAVAVLRPPIGAGLEGAINAVAISPDDRTVVCGGATGFQWDKTVSAYVFDRSTGRIVDRITGLPDSVSSLVYSANGDLLAIGLVSGGLALYRTSDWTQIGNDANYTATVCGLSFHGDDAPILAAACLDGNIRVYRIDDSQANALVVQARAKSAADTQPYGVAISPDGSEVAVGSANSTAVTVMSTSDLSILKSYKDDVTVSDFFGANSLASVAWSPDGRTLYSAGALTDGYEAAIDAWDQSRAADSPGAGSDTPTTIDTSARNTIHSIAARPGGGFCFGADDGTFGVYDAAGKKVFERLPAIDNFNSGALQLLVDRTGKTVQFGFGASTSNTPIYSDPESHLRFSFVDRALSGPNPDGLSDRIMTDPAVDVELNFKGGKATETLNGATLTFDGYEDTLFAVAPDHTGAVFGSSSYLFCYNPDAKLRWKTRVPETAYIVNVSGDSRFAVASLGDGTIRWYRMTDGKELLALFPAVDGKRWVAWTPSGYYDCSAGGDDLIGWHINGASDEAASFYPASRFSHQFYRPDVIQKVLDTADEDEAVKEADDDNGRKKEQADIEDRLPPVVTILSPDYGADVDNTSVTVRYTVRTPAGAPVTSVKFLVDGRPVSRDRDLQLVDSSDARSATITIPEHDCTISVIARNEYGSSDAANVRLAWSGAAPQSSPKPTLYVLAIGVSAYPDPIPPLKYPAKDAADFVAAVEAQKGSLYKDVVVKELVDKDATRAHILEGFDWIEKQPTQYDVAMVFLSGHGVDDSLGNYYYAGVDIDPNLLRETGVPFTDIKDTIQSLACKTIFFIDTCHSGNALGTARLKSLDVNGVVNELSSAENGAVVFASSTGRQVSEESDEWGNGAFTKALVEGLDGKAANGSGGRITWMSLSRYISDRVKELTGGDQTPTTTTPSTVPDFPVAFVKPTGKQLN